MSLSHGELWQECERRGCDTEPVCVNCFLCDRHCTCPPPPSAEEVERERLEETARREAAAAARGAFRERLAGDDWEPTAFPIERQLSNGAWIVEATPERIGIFLDAVLERESWRAPRDNREPLADRRALVRHLAGVREMHHGDDWYAVIRLPAPGAQEES